MFAINMIAVTAFFSINLFYSMHSVNLYVYISVIYFATILKFTSLWTEAKRALELRDTTLYVYRVVLTNTH